MKWFIVLFLLYADERDPVKYEIREMFDTADECVEYTRSEEFKSMADVIFTKDDTWMIQPLCKSLKLS